MRREIRFHIPSLPLSTLIPAHLKTLSQRLVGKLLGFELRLQLFVLSSFVSAQGSLWPTHASGEFQCWRRNSPEESASWYTSFLLFIDHRIYKNFLSIAQYVQNCWRRRWKGRRTKKRRRRRGCRVNSIRLSIDLLRRGSTISTSRVGSHGRRFGRGSWYSGKISNFYYGFQNLYSTPNRLKRTRFQLITIHFNSFSVFSGLKRIAPFTFCRRIDVGPSLAERVAIHRQAREALEQSQALGVPL